MRSMRETRMKKRRSQQEQKKGQAENSYFGNLSVSIGGGVGKIGTR